jgi:hypothetical protein
MKHLFIALCLSVCLILPAYTMEPESLEQLFVDMLIESTIIAFENPQTRQQLSGLSDMIKDEQTYQYIMRRIDKFILANELEKYKQQAEDLKAFITRSRELYIESEKEALEKYQQLKEQQQQREKERQLREANVIEV